MKGLATCLMMMHSRALKWTAGIVLAPVVLAILFVLFFGWNWLRAPIEKKTVESTGRILEIKGDLKIKFGWPHPRIHADAVTFANPSWARERQMVSAEAVEVSVSLPQLLRFNIVLPEVHLQRPVVFLEQNADGRKNWLLDTEQRDEDARIRIDRLTIDHGTLGYDHAAQKTSIRAELRSENLQPGGAGVVFSAQGRFKGEPIKAHGKGGPVLGLRDESAPYPLAVELNVGQTGVKVEGTVTSLLKFSAVDMHLSLRGASLAHLFPLLDIAFPETRGYRAEGHLVHSGQSWRYEKFSGVIGDSDLAGTLQLETGGKRPALKGDLQSRVLDINDLGPLIGAKPGKVQLAREMPAPAPTVTTSARARVLPDIPFSADRWDSVDAEVTLKAGTIRRAKELPIENLSTHLSLRDSVLVLKPLDFGIAGGHLDAMISLDGRKSPIQARAQVRARKILVARLFPTLGLNQGSAGQINGEADLSGTGNSVAGMLAGSNGKVGLVVANGEFSRLMVEAVGLHLWEMLQLKIAGDRPVKLRCGVADFDVKNGTMLAEAIVLDTEVTTILGTGSIDLRQETLNLTVAQRTKKTALVALRPPIYIRGTFAHPSVELDKVQLAVRSLGAIALGAINPLLVLVPLIEAGPGRDSDCAQLVRDAKAMPRMQKTGSQP